MVKALHRAGIEVISSIVFSTTTTAEGNHLRPMLSFRGLDQRQLLTNRLIPDEPRLLQGLHRYSHSLNGAPSCCG